MSTRTEFIDLSHTLDANVQVYPGDPTFSCCPALTIAHDGMNVHALSMGSHTGTHVDAPYHFVASGQRIADLPLSPFVGPALVIDMSAKGPKEAISWADLAPYEAENAAQSPRPGRPRPPALHRLVPALAHPRVPHHPFLARDAAARIVEAGVRTLGVNTLSPDATRVDGPVDFGVHEAVLGAGGVVAENLCNLVLMQYGEWTVHLVPLKIGGCDGSPVRAFASRKT
ncbi:putative cyclase [Amylocystis lapponica]|nr:putative cyclase [Amylocystis lapponica]